jgi:quercetin dioxygenase-like cupin family protein
MDGMILIVRTVLRVIGACLWPGAQPRGNLQRRGMEDMMARLWTALALALLSSTPALAVGEMGKPAAAPVILRKDVPLYTVFAWERWGNFINAQAGGKTEIPYDAARLQVKVYTFPSGEIRAIRFPNGVRTHRHINLTDTVLYSWQAHRVQFVDDQAVLAAPGDFALHQKGVYHSGEEIRRGGGIDLEFAVNNPGIHNDPAGYWAFAKDNPIQDAASWRDGASVKEAIGPAAANAPANAARYRVRMAELPGFKVREMYLPKGAVLPIRETERDRLIFILSGRVSVSTGGKTYELGSEDAARAEKGKDVTITALEDAMWAQSLVPAVAAK